ncbi:uncharacterized protein LOC108733803 isoform X2 [Agrilus planipennis]|uniref:Uncharacterized protein LOC108733803 isoform X2 n=1 Tax=Agrilus planipennis TaxID=224129 RepID=A0A1W4W996_AGRPL|nr:uncharacterized protein LOC108733803 isoform X2 [Agrilus planipennis]
MKCIALLFLIAVLGFSLGDELGFKESLSNVENNRRRSAEGSKFQATIVQSQQANAGKAVTARATSNNQTRSAPGKQLNLAAVMPTKVPVNIPQFKPIPPAPERPVYSSVNSTRRVGNEIDSNLDNAQPASASKPRPFGLPDQPFKSQKDDGKLSSTNLSLRTLPSPSNNEVSSYSKVPLNPIQVLSGVTNISAEVLEAAILMRERELLRQKSSTTYKPPHTPVRHITSSNKVMNAPKEYYPAGYDKNFDDNFASRVDLPETSFYCGDQKHFPGLYADEDLGCMVFHVCALTDDGLVMKSFLCPESTLFDQTILKCNWWFYVDCKNSKKLYDSNIPISKSYQLMKALTFFSTYKKGGTAKSKTKD